MSLSLEESIERFGQAWAARDVETLRTLLSPDYVHTDFEGRVFDRESWLAYAARQSHGSTVAFHGVERRIYGSVAVVLGANDIVGGSMGAATIRFTQVWHSTAEGWRRVAFQATLSKERPA